MKLLLSFALYLALMLLVLLDLPVALAQTNVTTTSTLTPPGHITSPSGDFAFGFRALVCDPNQFLLAVWFHFNATSPSQQTVAWYAKESDFGSSVIATRQSVLGLTTEGQCRDFCLSDCFCTAALFDDHICAKMAAMTAGQQANGTTSMALIKVRTSYILPLPYRHRRKVS